VNVNIWRSLRVTQERLQFWLKKKIPQECHIKSGTGTYMLYRDRAIGQLQKRLVAINTAWDWGSHWLGAESTAGFKGRAPGQRQARSWNTQLFDVQWKRQICSLFGNLETQKTRRL